MLRSSSLLQQYERVRNTGSQLSTNIRGLIHTGTCRWYTYPKNEVPGLYVFVYHGIHST